MGLSNNRLYPAQKVQKNTQNVHGEGDDQPWDFGGDPMSDKPWQTYVWHWSLQFSRENSLSHILVFMWYSSPFWCRKRLSNSLGLSVFKTYLVHSDSWFQINRKKNNWLGSKVLRFAGSFAQCFQWLYGCIGTPTGLWSVAPKPPILLVKFTCADLADFCEKKTEVCCSYWLRKKLVPEVPEFYWWCLLVYDVFFAG